MANEQTTKREIRFRIWNGSEMVYDVMVGKFGAFYVNPGDKGNGLDPKDSASLTTFNTKYHEGTPVMQFTGLLDKNAKEIYEGDIVTYIIKGYTEEDNAVEYTEEVKFEGGCFNVDGYAPVVAFHEEMEVIGNIYANPSMLGFKPETL